MYRLRSLGLRKNSPPPNTLTALASTLHQPIVERGEIMGRSPQIRPARIPAETIVLLLPAFPPYLPLPRFLVRLMLALAPIEPAGERKFEIR